MDKIQINDVRRREMLKTLTLTREESPVDFRSLVISSSQQRDRKHVVDPGREQRTRDRVDIWNTPSERGRKAGETAAKVRRSWKRKWKWMSDGERKEGREDD